MNVVCLCGVLVVGCGLEADLMVVVVWVVKRDFCGLHAVISIGLVSISYKLNQVGCRS